MSCVWQEMFKVWQDESFCQEMLDEVEGQRSNTGKFN